MERLRQLQDGQVYTVDGGYFRAKRIEEDEGEDGRFELWTYLGARGSIVTRTGFDVSYDGRLSHRIHDVDTDEHQLVASDLTVNDLEEVEPQAAAEAILPQGYRDVPTNEPSDVPDDTESPWG